jgi:tryptophanyl-tRNA synthetase
MTQFKEKSLKNADNINAGLYTYPVLQAADILLYNTHLVPIGEDQKQHLELSRDIAIRFNHAYGNLFVIPEPYIAPTGARIMGLQEPTQKMSKSESGNDGDFISLLDTPDAMMKKFKRAVTDSGREIRFDPVAQPGVSNLLSIYACATGKTIPEAEADFADAAGYGVLKVRTGEAVVEMLAPCQARYAELCADDAYIDALITQGAERAAEIAQKTIIAVKDAVGFPI